MTFNLYRRRLLPYSLLGAIAFTGVFPFAAGPYANFPQSAYAQEATTLAQLAQLTAKKGFKDIGLGEVCDHLHLGGACKVYQLNATIDPAESKKFGLPAGWQTSLNVLRQQGGAYIVITDHDQYIGYAYLVGSDAGLQSVIVGLSAGSNGKDWRWKPAPLTDKVAQKFASEKAYWLAQIKDIQGLPDRKE